MFKVLILVCSTALPQGQCQVDTAVSVINGPESPDARLCGLNGQAYVAGTSIGALHEGEYVKVKCSRTAIGGTVG